MIPSSVTFVWVTMNQKTQRVRYKDTKQRHKTNTQNSCSVGRFLGNSFGTQKTKTRASCQPLTTSSQPVDLFQTKERMRVKVGPTILFGFWWSSVVSSFSFSGHPPNNINNNNINININKQPSKASPSVVAAVANSERNAGEATRNAENHHTTTHKQEQQKPKIVLVAGFESFNKNLYETAANDAGVELKVFADSDIRSDKTSVDDKSLGVNPEFVRAMNSADAFIGSLIFDYDDGTSFFLLILRLSLCDSFYGSVTFFICQSLL